MTTRKATATADPYGMTKQKGNDNDNSRSLRDDNQKGKSKYGVLLISFLLFCFDEGFGLFEEGEVFFVVCGLGVFDHDPLFHGSFAHGQ